MIKFVKRPPAPKVLLSKKVTDTITELNKKSKSGKLIKSSDIKPHWLDDILRATLWEYQHKKCCFCERKRELKRESDVEHYRPKAGVTGEPNHPGYWWLAYDWENLLYACKHCNQEFKKNNFPLQRGGIRAKKPDDNLEQEKPILIDPSAEDPEQFLGFNWYSHYGKFVYVIGIDRDGRGNETCRILGLNEKSLPEERARLLKSFEAIEQFTKGAKFTDNKLLLDENIEKIRNLTKSNNHFVGFARAYFRGVGLQGYVSNN